jgi:hypothetical protein
MAVHAGQSPVSPSRSQATINCCCNLRTRVRSPDRRRHRRVLGLKYEHIYRADIGDQVSWQVCLG